MNNAKARGVHVATIRNPLDDLISRAIPFGESRPTGAACGIMTGLDAHGSTIDFDDSSNDDLKLMKPWESTLPPVAAVVE